MECLVGATTPISGESILVQLEKILASPRFVHSGRLKRFQTDTSDIAWSISPDGKTAHAAG